MSRKGDRFTEILRRTRVLMIPEQRIATFGDRAIEYSLCSPAGARDASCRLRQGAVTCRKPKILSAQAMLERFRGFGRDAARFQRWLEDHDEEKLRALEYAFHNELESTRLLKRPPLEVAESIRREARERGAKRAAVLVCPNEGWNLALMKFILDETWRSLGDNVRELEEHGLFDPGAAAVNAQRAEIEALFQQAAKDPARVKRLGRRLQELGLFADYEDRFYRLLPPEGHA